MYGPSSEQFPLVSKLLPCFAMVIHVDKHVHSLSMHNGFYVINIEASIISKILV